MPEQFENDMAVSEALLAQGFTDIRIARDGPIMTVTAQRKPPSRWGDRAWLEATFCPASDVLSFEVKHFVFRYASALEFVEELRRFYGPIHKAFGALDADAQKAPEHELLAAMARFNTATDGTLRLPSAYAEIVLAKA